MVLWYLRVEGGGSGGIQEMIGIRTWFLAKKKKKKKAFWKLK